MQACALIEQTCGTFKPGIIHNESTILHVVIATVNRQGLSVTEQLI